MPGAKVAHARRDAETRVGLFGCSAVFVQLFEQLYKKQPPSKMAVSNSQLFPVFFQIRSLNGVIMLVALVRLNSINNRRRSIPVRRIITIPVC